ncbi:MAG TPA: polysaccharide deacetylase family protein [bacterium]|nr:polysaccharide deacetylase family protein [bacterium]
MFPLILLLLPAQLMRPDIAVPPGLDTFDLSDHTVVLSVDDGYHSVYENVYPLLKRYHMTMTLALITGCITEGKPSYSPSDRFLNEREIREMLDSCDIEIASHTVTHAWLTRISTTSAWWEITESKRHLESMFGRPVITFVYPYGDMNGRIRDLVRRAGYKLAREVGAGTPNLWVEPYRIPEVELRIDARLPAIMTHIRRNKTTVILLHRIVQKPRVFTEWPVTDFAALLDWIHERRVRVVTLEELYREWWRDKLKRTLLGVTTKSDSGRLFQDVDIDATRTTHPR